MVIAHERSVVWCIREESFHEEVVGIVFPAPPIVLMPPQDGSPALRVRADRHHWWVREALAPGSDQADVDLRVRPGLEVGSIEGPVSPLAKVLAFSFVHLPLPAQCLRRREPVEVRGDLNQIGDGTQALGAGPRFGRLAHGLSTAPPSSANARMHRSHTGRPDRTHAGVARCGRAERLRPAVESAPSATPAIAPRWCRCARSRCACSVRRTVRAPARSPPGCGRVRGRPIPCLDGRGFSKLTRRLNLKKPYDTGFRERRLWNSRCRSETTWIRIAWRARRCVRESTYPACRQPSSRHGRVRPNQSLRQHSWSRLDHAELQNRSANCPRLRGSRFRVTRAAVTGVKDGGSAFLAVDSTLESVDPRPWVSAITTWPGHVRHRCSNARLRRRRSGPRSRKAGSDRRAAPRPFGR